VAEVNKVVVHFLNSKLLKGTTQDFFPNRPVFHLQPMDGGPAFEVHAKELKAVFFVKDFDGNGARRDLRGFVAAAAETSQGKKIAVRFKDGELLCGYSLSYSPERLGFFMFPADPGSNNTRVFVIKSSAQEVKAGPGADALAQRVIQQSKAA
jgi:hypothetical protein